MSFDSNSVEDPSLVAKGLQAQAFPNGRAHYWLLPMCEMLMTLNNSSAHCDS